ncbi:MAG: DUF6484 domain-containing protein [Mariniblastus sp.]
MQPETYSESDASGEVPTVETSAGKPSMIDKMLDQEASKIPTHVEGSQVQTRRIDGLLIGSICDVNADGYPVVTIPGVVERATAQTVCDVSTIKIGDQCAMMFQAGSPDAPVILGVLQQPVIALGSTDPISYQQTDECIEIRSNTEINFHCGEAHFRMTSEGLIELRGNKVVSHSTGLNRIRGASVKLN